ncbi:MAG: hypothetical protein IIY44_07290 [Erysipelotrichales bacterium]|nr:hypothetical protein [Erysipelotrichales bacterium]
MDSAVFKVSPGKEYELIRMLRCLDPRSDILRGVKVYEGNNEIVSSGVQVFSFGENAEEFFWYMNRLAEIFPAAEVLILREGQKRYQTQTGSAHEVKNIPFIILGHTVHQHPEFAERMREK